MAFVNDTPQGIMMNSSAFTSTIITLIDKWWDERVIGMSEQERIVIDHNTERCLDAAIQTFEDVTRKNLAAWRKPGIPSSEKLAFVNKLADSYLAIAKTSKDKTTSQSRNHLQPPPAPQSCSDGCRWL